MNKNQFVLSQKNMWYVNQFPQRNNRRGCGVVQVGLRIPLVGPIFGPLPWAGCQSGKICWENQIQKQTGIIMAWNNWDYVFLWLINFTKKMPWQVNLENLPWIINSIKLAAIWPTKEDVWVDLQPKTFLLACQRVSESQQNKSKACAAATSASATDESPTARKTLTWKLMSHRLGGESDSLSHPTDKVTMCATNQTVNAEERVLPAFVLYEAFLRTSETSNHL